MFRCVLSWRWRYCGAFIWPVLWGGVSSILPRSTWRTVRPPGARWQHRETPLHRKGCSHLFLILNNVGKSKAIPRRALGRELISICVQSAWSRYVIVGCHCCLPGSRFAERHRALANTKLYCLVTETRVWVTFLQMLRNSRRLTCRIAEYESTK